MNRICLQEKILSEYLSGVISREERVSVEKHLASCSKCRKTVSEAYEILNQPDVKEFLFIAADWIKINKWLIATALLLSMSFVISEYFLQFLIASVITGVKWIIDSKTTKMLITVHKALSTNTEKITHEEEK